MATWQALSIATGQVEGPKYIETAVVDEIWSVALPTSLALGDTILGPSISPGNFLSTVTIATDQLDTGAGITLSAGYAGNLAAWISTTSVAQTGGIQGANVASALGFTATTNTQMLVTVTRGASTPKAGIMRLKLTFTASP